MAKGSEDGSKPSIKGWSAIPRVGVIGVYGHRRKGKTATAWWLAELFHAKREQPVASFMFPSRARRLLPSWVKHVNDIGQLRRLRGYLVVADELALHAHARNHQSEPNKELFKLMAVAGQCHQLLLLICQHTRQLDVGLAMEPDMLILKQPSLLHIRFARPELRPEVQQAYDTFLTAPGDKRRFSFVVDYHEGRTGFLRNPLPSFWSQELSEAYARYEMESLTREPKKAKKAKKRGRAPVKKEVKSE